MWWLAQVQTPSVNIPSFTLPTIIVALLIAVLIGGVAQLLVGYTHIGCVGHILVGIVGAFLGSLIASWLRLPTILVIAGIDVVWTFLGSAILVAILAIIFGGSRFGGFYRNRGGYGRGSY
ncbi:MAG TPA: hypothetical protein VKQ72_20815 [Aggregatilineales bacterium]|nr:hypothetical protein [Aggregatilineales bacterium]